MALIRLVRHGRAAAGWGEHPDPGLDGLGRQQAAGTAATIAESIDPCRLLTSPLARAQETAEPLRALWGRDLAIEPAFGEIPSPTSDLADRSAWLSLTLASRWSDLDDAVGAWREQLLAAVLGIEADAVVFTHFVAINAVVSHAQQRRDVTVFLPANASVTVVDVAPSTGQIEVVSLGAEASPDVG